MKICLIGIPSVHLGKHNLKDPRLDQADKLAEAKKKTYAQADIIAESDAADADALLVHRDALDDLLLKDLEFIETRLSRNAAEPEAAALRKAQAALEEEKPVSRAGLSPEEQQALGAHSFMTNKPVIVATDDELKDVEALLLRAFREGGFISFLTVGGKENRAWPIQAGTTAWDAAGAIHSDIQKGFIRAEVISFSDFVEGAGETGAKRAGKLRLELKNYIVQDCDVVNFRFNK